MVTIDGEAIPSVWGTGTEDYFLCAWGLERTLTPYFGVPYFDQWGIVGGHTSAYRWHINDPFVFRKSIKVEFETFGWIAPDENPEHRAMSWNPRQDDYSSVAFWYQTGIPTFSARAPHAKERRLPSLERQTVKLADLMVAREVSGGPQRPETPEGTERRLAEITDTGSVAHGAGSLWIESLAQADGGSQLLYEPSNGTGFVEVPFSVSEQEPLRLLFVAMTGPDCGIWQASLDGSKLQAPVDLYSATTESREVHLLDFWPSAGAHTLRLECVGKSHGSSGSRLGLQSVRLRERRPRVAEMAHERDDDWRVDPKLYA
jgi:hypothetical protein